MKPLWNLSDLIDLQFFIQADEEIRHKEGEGALCRRDRIIYLTKIEPQLGGNIEVPPKDLLHKWLGSRRLLFHQEKPQGEAVLPGTIWREVYLLFRALFFLGGLLSGIGLAGAYLLYSGRAPLNVSAFFALFVIAQVLLILFQAGFFSYRYCKRLPHHSSLLLDLVGRLLLTGANRLAAKLQNRLSGEQRMNLAALLGGLKQRKEQAGLLFWPAFILLQLYGLGFNLGVLGSSLVKVVFFDVAFAWQSSLQLSAEAVAHLVQVIALPWAWLVPHGYPSLQEVQGSQMVLKEGIAHLATGDLVSWWPFLCCAVAFYGLLPRLILFLLGRSFLDRSLDKLTFSGLDFTLLLRRMFTPRVDTAGTEHAEEPVRPAEEKRKPTPSAVAAASSRVRTPEPSVVPDRPSVTAKQPAPAQVAPVQKTQVDKPAITPPVQSIEPTAKQTEMKVVFGGEQVAETAKAPARVTVAQETARPKVAAQRQKPVAQKRVDRIWITLIPEELYEECPMEALQELLVPLSTGGRIVPQIYEAYEQTLAESIQPLKDATQGGTLRGVHLLQEAWQPPLREHETLLVEIRKSIGVDIPVYVVLIGKPQRDTILTRPDSKQQIIWSQKMRAIGDPQLRVIPLIQS